MIESIRHFQHYWYYYINLLFTPLFYIKITHYYSWNELPIVSTKFVLFYFVTFLLQVFTMGVACFIQLQGMTKTEDDQFKWRSVGYRCCYYILPVGLGLLVLTIFTFLWYEKKGLSLVMMQHAQSRFLIYAIFFMFFTIILDYNRKRNWIVKYFYKSSAYADKEQQQLVILEQPEPHSMLDKVVIALEKFTGTIENSATSIMDQQKKMRDDQHVKGLVKEAMQEYEDEHPVLQEHMKMHGNQDVKELVKEAMQEFVNEQPVPQQPPQVHDDQVVKGLVKEVIQELEIGQEKLKDVPLENLYTSLYARCPTRLKPAFVDGKVMFYHIFAIETHSKNAIVILTDGTRIQADKMLHTLEDLGLLTWMVKVSRFYFINMMHVCIVAPVDGMFVRIQALTLDSIVENLEKKYVLKICALGKYVQDHEINKFLEAKSERSYEGWDTLVRLS